MQIDLPDHLVKALDQKACLEGVSTQVYLNRLVQQDLASSVGNQPSGRPFKSGYGMLAGFGPAPSEEEIDQNRAELARRKVAVSAISIVELVYLIKKERLPPSAYEALVSALRDPEHVLTEADFTAAIAASMRSISREDVPDMPDRMIAATAVHLGVPILSRDRRIHSANLNTLW